MYGMAVLSYNQGLLDNGHNIMLPTQNKRKEIYLTNIKK